MRPEEHERSFRHEDSNWLHVAMFEADERSADEAGGLSARLLDVGCGTGGWLARRAQDFGGGAVFGCDSSIEAVRFARSRGLRNLFVGSTDRLPVRTGAFASATCRHVIEHVEDDAAALREVARAVRPGGLVLVGVPALRWIRTVHDVANHHRRRYGRADLVGRLRAAGLEPVLVRFLNLAFVPAAALLTLVERLRPTDPARSRRLHVVPGALNRLLLLYARAEAAVLRRLPVPLGLSLVAVARRT